MNPVYMHLNDDCLKCCLASILELEWEETPHFAKDGEAWSLTMEAWLITRGLTYILNPSKFDFAVGVGKSPRHTEKEVHHAVVIDSDFEIVHDPFKDGEPVGKLIYWFSIERISDVKEK